jgi:hypothetical protein
VNDNAPQEPAAPTDAQVSQGQEPASGGFDASYGGPRSLSEYLDRLEQRRAAASADNRDNDLGSGS